jgi:hypothetical protein
MTTELSMSACGFDELRELRQEAVWRRASCDDLDAGDGRWRWSLVWIVT